MRATSPASRALVSRARTLCRSILASASVGAPSLPIVGVGLRVPDALEGLVMGLRSGGKGGSMPGEFEGLLRTVVTVGERLADRVGERAGDWRAGDWRAGEGRTGD